MRETDHEFGVAHDRWLANFHQYGTTVYCDNPDCGNHQGTIVLYVSEYGQGWYEPEECESCGGDWLEQQPDPPDEDDPEEPQEPTSAPPTHTPTL